MSKPNVRRCSLIKVHDQINNKGGVSSRESGSRAWTQCAVASFPKTLLEDSFSYIAVENYKPMFHLGNKNSKWGWLITFGIWLVGLKKLSWKIISWLWW